MTKPMRTQFQIHPSPVRFYPGNGSKGFKGPLTGIGEEPPKKGDPNQAFPQGMEPSSQQTAEPAEPLQTFQTPQASSNLVSSSPLLATRQEQSSFQKIRIASVLSDFKSTMDALGADASVKQQAAVYLNVVEVESRKEVPGTGLIKHALKGAADVLDGFITQALGQPSRVVKDWVDALMLQSIDFKQTDALPEEFFSALNGPSDKKQVSGTLADKDAESEKPSSLSSVEKKEIKRLLADSRAAQQNELPEQAFNTLEKAYHLLQGKNQPSWEGSLAYKLGKQADHLGNRPAAKQYYQAALASYQKSDLSQPDKTARLHEALGVLADEEGDWKKAKTHYQESLALLQPLGKASAVLKLKNSLAGVYFQEGNLLEALKTWKQTYQELKTNPGKDETLVVDVLSNIGQAYSQLNNPQKAAQSYQLALKHLQTLPQTPTVVAIANALQNQLHA